MQLMVLFINFRIWFQEHAYLLDDWRFSMFSFDYKNMLQKIAFVIVYFIIWKLLPILRGYVKVVQLLNFLCKQLRYTESSPQRRWVDYWAWPADVLMSAVAKRRRKLIGPPLEGQDRGCSCLMSGRRAGLFQGSTVQIGTGIITV